MKIQQNVCQKSRRNDVFNLEYVIMEINVNDRMYAVVCWFFDKSFQKQEFYRDFDLGLNLTSKKLQKNSMRRTLKNINHR